ncbi:MAG: radical SAM protein [Desulfatiglandales bacterium]
MVSLKEEYIEMNKLEYGQKYPLLNWVSAGEAEKSTRTREKIIGSLPATAQFGSLNTKLFTRSLSPGCQLCARGKWSCLFINGICNARCFYCPTAQPSRGEPTTNTIRFPSPDDYLDYIEKLKFTGVSISGGEPFLTFDRTIRFVSTIKRRFGNGIYLWLYTNGITVTRDKLKALTDAGLDEIRFNISANHYEVDKVKLAVDLVETVTVEVPAIPEDYELLKSTMTRLEEIGVRFLNLHQLRCTPYNRDNLIRRGYTLLHGPKATVMESELTALRLLRHASEQDIRLPVNYCSFAYQNRFETAAYRQRFAPFVCKPFEDITEAGTIRRMSITGQPEHVDHVVKLLTESNCNRNSWRFEREKYRLTLAQSLWKYVDIDRFSLFLSYYIAKLASAPCYRHPFEKVHLNRRKTLVVEKKTVIDEREIVANKAALLQYLADSSVYKDASGNSPGRHSPKSQFPSSTDFEDIRELERIKPELQEYY